MLEINAVRISARFIFSSLFFVSLSMAQAEIPDYSSTDNTGLNKKERIDAVETYLANVSKSLQSMEAKLSENSKKLIELDKVVKAIKDEQAKTQAKEQAKDQSKKPEAKLGEVKKSATDNPSAASEASELEKLKADILTLKNQDIEKLKTNLDELSETVKAIQATLKK